MNRSVIVIATANRHCHRWFNYFYSTWEPDPPRPPRPGPEASDEETTKIGDDSPGFHRPRELQITQPAPPTQTETETVSVSINSIPWARVFIKLPKNDYFMEPRARDFTIPLNPTGEILTLLRYQAI